MQQKHSVSMHFDPAKFQRALLRLVRQRAARSSLAGQAGRPSPIPTGCGCRKSCCNKPQSKPSSLISRRSWRNGRRRLRWRRRRATRCSRPGPGLAITRAPAIFTPARKRGPRRLSAKRGGLARAPRRRRLHGRRNRSHSIRRTGRRRGRQCRASRRATVRAR